jgi:hypothetical protein
MLLAEAWTSFLWLFLGASIVSGIVVLIRVVRSGPPDSSSPNRLAEPELETGVGKRIAMLEVRLHDFAREVEARLETRALQLDQLVLEADREITRLTDLLGAVPGGRLARTPDLVRFADAAAGAELPRPTHSSTSSERSIASAIQTVGHLRDAGYSVPEIAHLVGLSTEQVDRALRAA